jgi:hypothetical protein
MTSAPDAASPSATARPIPEFAPVAAATTSLPEQIGGPRNWDYRFWVRDATLTRLALMGAGYYDEARAWRDSSLRISTLPSMPSTSLMTFDRSVFGGMKSMTRTLPWSVLKVVSKIRVPGRIAARSRNDWTDKASNSRSHPDQAVGRSNCPNRSGAGRSNQSIRRTRPRLQSRNRQSGRSLRSWPFGYPSSQMDIPVII